MLHIAYLRFKILILSELCIFCLLPQVSSCQPTADEQTIKSVLTFYKIIVYRGTLKAENISLKHGAEKQRVDEIGSLTYQ